jgi:hypothetical protein
MVIRRAGVLLLHQQFLQCGLLGVVDTFRTLVVPEAFRGVITEPFNHLITQALFYESR